ncbi:winged helix-turn-helix domain-containing protein [Rheinheimera muenzenbergensis]|uniref:Winged helix-turn-helix domain-containing protein n=1 Tax=Rheinheimera muenzenbergensis TaxID=1193628 RepID=A0ABU8C396_9GAMM
MSQQYWIGGFYIDLSRNQITHLNETTTLAPKALAVLTYLAQHQGKVVSQDELLTEVWQGTIVSPNTLQRSITQLRKALGDDGKVQGYIKTHAKKGYSLEADVRWQPEAAPQPAAAAAPMAAAMPAKRRYAGLTQFNLGLLLFAVLLVTMLLGAGLLWQGFLPQTTTQFKISEFRPLTANDNKEVAGIYSPDGQYIVFHRYSTEFCRNTIWAKHIKTQQEFQLSKNLDSNGAHSFSTDGKSLIFVQSRDCTEPLTQKTCYHLMSLDFDAALLSPQAPKRLLECKNSAIKNPQWLDDNHIALLQQKSGHWSLIRYVVAADSSDTLYEVSDGNVLSYDYSAKDKLIAVVSQSNDGSYYLTMLRPDGEQLSGHAIRYPSQIARFKSIYPNFSPFENQLIFSTGRQLFTLSYDGQINPVELPIDDAMGTPVFHPDGNRMLVTKGQYDSDIVALPLAGTLANNEQKPAQAALSGTIIARSVKAENNALFQPGGKLIAFQSARSGQLQVWLSDGHTTWQLSHFPTDTYLYGMHWAKDGNSLLVNTDYALSQLFLDGSQHSLPFKYPIHSVFHYDSIANTALVKLQINGVLKFAEVNLASATREVINNAEVTQAVKTAQGRLIYTDQLDRFWLQGPVEDLLIEPLSNQVSNKGFVVYGDTLYGINKDFQLWRYAVDTEHFAVIAEVPKTVDAITAANATQILLTQRINGRKEVVELVLAD